ncbi:protein artichoke [Diorhabda sublineata]|uniref:protein artichoke n=1 Tax=Diorhabda sublineata TaxID=1163346 RepID=UPI0024E11911|nr:protein artichoke [Diorhabda sublineata]XP_056646848.1 protein artichoke [Diorhabda sublineata]XP_056646849.1 protein artichoke [Diorhabda sublineata]XP_056646850.1 protein artichoke [Diorhabda sublineata]
MKYFLLLFAALAVDCRILAEPCIDHCVCNSKLLSRLQVISCDKPLVLNSTTFQNIDKNLTNVISFSDVIIDQIQENAFRDFKNLDDVMISGSNIGSIDAKSFNNVERLKFVDCAFEDSPDLFSEQLEELHFGSSRLDQIPNLNNLLKLTFLNLSGNYIKYVEVEAFTELFDLEELHLSNNEIFRLPATVFINNQQLLTLNLDNNPLNHFAINTSESLEILSLRNCRLDKFDKESARKLTSVNELNLSHNNIKNLSSETFAHMTELSVIDLSYNKLTDLDENVFAENGRLIRITLDGNDFNTLPVFYRKNEETFSIYSFSCRYCNLNTLSSNVFENMEDMINLYLSHNNFLNVDNMFDKIKNLKVLDISDNNIAYFSPGAFKNNKNLEVLNIAGNPLMVLNPEVFAGNYLLRDIDVRNASLTKLWSNYNKSVKSLRRLLLGGNNLGTLTSDDFVIMPALEAIELHNNPLIFDNKLCTLFSFLEVEGINPIDASSKKNNAADGAFREDTDGFITIQWKDVHGGMCPEEIPFNSNDDKTKYITNNEDDEDDDNDDDEDDDDYDEDDDYYIDNENDEETSTKFSKENASLAKATYILSVTSAFVLSALIVLTIAVTITLCVLRRNNGFDMQKANLPRLKIPLWNTTQGHKKHSGSVYRPLSEDLSGPKTPKLSRYDFTSTPVVHSA